MDNLAQLSKIVDRFKLNISFYKNAKNAYNEHSCRIEYIDPFLKILGWDVSNERISTSISRSNCRELF